jgi:hypothetical protein
LPQHLAGRLARLRSRKTQYFESIGNCGVMKRFRFRSILICATAPLTTGVSPGQWMPGGGHNDDEGGAEHVWASTPLAATQSGPARIWRPARVSARCGELVGADTYT